MCWFTKSYWCNWFYRLLIWMFALCGTPIQMRVFPPIGLQVEVCSARCVNKCSHFAFLTSIYIDQQTKSGSGALARLCSLSRSQAKPWYIIFFIWPRSRWNYLPRAIRKIHLIAPCCEILIFRLREASNNAQWCIIVQDTSFGFLIFTRNSAAELTVF